MQLVTGFHRPDTRGRAGINQVARLKRVVLGEIGDLLGHRPDHVGEIRALALLAVDIEPDRAFRRVADLRRGREHAAGRRFVEILAELPWPAVVLAPLLQVAPRHVEAHRIAEYVLARPFCVDAPAAFADGDDHLGLIVIIRSFSRVVHFAATRHQRVRALEKEERLLATAAAHLFLVLGVVAPDAEDAAHRKDFRGARYRHCGRVPRRDRVIHRSR